MHTRFDLTGKIFKIKEVKNGLIITVMEPPINHLSKPNFENVAIWGVKAQSIKSKLKRSATFNFQGSIEKKQVGRKIYHNLTVDRWKLIPKPEKKYEARPERDDDWYVPEPENRDSKSHRLSEGFPI